MWQNYLKTALRNLLKNKGFSFINLFGLAVGLTCCLLIGLYIANELSFDRYHSKAERIYRVSREFMQPDGTQQLHLGHLAPPFGPLIDEEFSELEEVLRMLQTNATFRYEDQLFQEQELFFAEPAVFRIFDIPVVKGNAATALNEPFTVMLNETTARRIFGDRDPMNQTLRFNGNFDVLVTGVFEDFPYNSHFHPNMLASFATMRDTSVYGEENLRTNFGNNSFSTFLLLPENYDAGQLEARFPAFIDKILAPFSDNATGKPSDFTRLHLMPLTDIHLRSHLDSELEENGDIRRVYLFGIIAVFILLIGCVNYMNLSTARATVRAREIGIRKTVGAQRGEIIAQFLSEAVLLALGATILAIGLSLLALPVINKVLGQNLALSAQQLWILPVALVGLTIITGLLAGVYPAFFLSALRPLQVLKGDTPGEGSSKSRGTRLRQLLVVGQFVISSVLIIATLVVYRQLSFLQEKNLGLNKEQVVTLNYYSSLAPRYESFRNELLANPAISDVTRSTRLPSGRLLDSYGSAQVQINSDSMLPSSADLKFVFVDSRFMDLYEVGIASGRDFQSEQGSDRTENFLVNEAGIRMLGWKTAEEATGERIQYAGRDGRIIGVTNDFNFESLHQAIQPMIFLIPRDSTQYNWLSVRIDAKQGTQAIAHIQTLWRQFQPEFPFDYQFLDEQFGQLYEAEQRQGRLFLGFSLIAILIACLGLFGLAYFVTQQRVREIGIRKVLGASVQGLVGMLARDFLKLAAFGLLIAVPVAAYLMRRWLEDFAYRIGLEWWIFVLAAVLAIGIAFLTVSVQSLRAATSSPVKALRSE